MKEAISRKKDAYMAMCRNSTEENMNRYEGMKIKAMRAVPSAMTEKAEEGLLQLRNCQSEMYWLAKGLRINIKEFEGVRCVRRRDGKLCFSEKEGSNI